MSYAVLAPRTVRAKLRQKGLAAGDAEVERVHLAIHRSLDQLGNRYPVLLDEGDVEGVCGEALAEHIERTPVS